MTARNVEVVAVLARRRACRGWHHVRQTDRRGGPRPRDSRLGVDPVGVGGGGLLGMDSGGLLLGCRRPTAGPRVRRSTAFGSSTALAAVMLAGPAAGEAAGRPGGLFREVATTEAAARGGADLVHLVVADSDVGGRTSRPGAFSLDPRCCFARELGHNMGLGHDRYEVQEQINLTGASTRVHPLYGKANQRPSRRVRRRRVSVAEDL